MVDWSVVKMKGVESGMKIVALGRKRAQMQIWLWLDLHAKKVGCRTYPCPRGSYGYVQFSSNLVVVLSSFDSSSNRSSGGGSSSSSSSSSSSCSGGGSSSNVYSRLSQNSPSHPTLQQHFPLDVQYP